MSLSIRELAKKTSASKSQVSRLRNEGFSDEEIMEKYPLESSSNDPTPNKKVEVTPTKKISSRCHGCKEEVNELVCICHECIGKGVTHRSLGLDINK